MNQETIARLLNLNRAFYRAFAGPFADSRSVSDPALTPIVPHIPQGARVLDAGCGNGRLAVLLDRRRPGCSYVGVDLVPELVERARAATADLERTAVALHVADVTAPDWTAVLPAGRFDRAVALALLHHLPSYALRAGVVRDLAGLLRPGGRLLLSAWQFLSSARLRRKIVPWEEVALAPEDLEAGDYLLDWKRGGRGLRYCHLLDEAEIAGLATAAGCIVEESFRAGGREGNLSLFAVLAPVG